MDRRIILAAALALGVPALILSLSKSAQAQTSGRCTHETLTVRGIPLSVSYCITGSATAQPGHDLPIHVAESYSTAHGTVNQSATLRFIAGEDSSRVMEDLPLGRLGLQGTLHLTLLLRGGEIRVDSAMLTPGAITVK
jgi:hypothetical protein